MGEARAGGNRLVEEARHHHRTIAVEAVKARLDDFRRLHGYPVEHAASVEARHLAELGPGRAGAEARDLDPVRLQFLVKRFGQHVFARGAYRGRSVPKPTGETGGRGFTYGRTRLPISELYTLGPADMFQRRSVVDRMNDRVDEQAPAVFRREIAAVARGF